MSATTLLRGWPVVAALQQAHSARVSVDSLAVLMRPGFPCADDDAGRGYAYLHLRFLGLCVYVCK